MIFTRGTGTTRFTDAHYYQRRNNPFGNTYNKIVKCPGIANIYFTNCSKIDFHNKQHQGHLKLEKNGQPKFYGFVCQLHSFGYMQLICTNCTWKFGDTIFA